MKEVKEFHLTACLKILKSKHKASLNHKRKDKLGRMANNIHSLRIWKEEMEKIKRKW